MGTRIELQAELENILGSRNVYFEPPENISMKYPAIVYYRNRIDNSHANNSVYKQDVSYNITVIDSNPDSEIVTKMSKLPKCRFDRSYKSDNLNHNVFTLYY